MKADYVHKDTLTATDYVELNKNNELLISYNQELLKENQSLKKQLEEYEATNEVLSHELTKDKLLQQDCLTTCCGIPVGDIPKFIDKYNKLENNWNELKKYIQDICCYDEVGLRIIDPSYLEDKIAELERGVSNE